MWSSRGLKALLVAAVGLFGLAGYGSINDAPGLVESSDPADVFVRSRIGAPDCGFHDVWGVEDSWSRLEDATLDDPALVYARWVHAGSGVLLERGVAEGMVRDALARLGTCSDGSVDWSVVGG